MWQHPTDWLSASCLGSKIPQGDNAGLHPKFSFLPPKCDLLPFKHPLTRFAGLLHCDFQWWHLPTATPSAPHLFSWARSRSFSQGAPHGIPPFSRTCGCDKSIPPSRIFTQCYPKSAPERWSQNPFKNNIIIPYNTCVQFKVYFLYSTLDSFPLTAKSCLGLLS